jgi:L-lactate utilization protein LutB
MGREAGGLGVQDQPSHIVRPCLKKKKVKEIGEINFNSIFSLTQYI